EAGGHVFNAGRYGLRLSVAVLPHRVVVYDLHRPLDESPVARVVRVGHDAFSKAWIISRPHRCLDLLRRSGLWREANRYLIGRHRRWGVLPPLRQIVVNRPHLKPTALDDVRSALHDRASVLGGVGVPRKFT